MLQTEVAELMNKNGKVYELASKSVYKRDMTAEEKDAVSVMDAWSRKIGETGYDEGHEIASFLRRSVQEEIYNAPDELLDSMFVRGTIGEFDDYEAVTTPKNTLIAYEAAKGGNVDRSYIDISVLTPKWRNRQVETDISYIDMRRNGFKSIALLTTYATEACQNYMFADMFGAVDAAIVGGEQKIDVTGSAPTQDAMDKLSLYLTDRDSNAMVVALTKYCQAIGRMDGYSEYMSQDMKDDFNRYGLVKFFNGVRVAGISSAKKMGNGQLLIPDKRIFGIAGTVGTLDMKGEVHVYETEDNNSEVIHIKVADFTYGYAITNIDNAAKVTFSA